MANKTSALENCETGAVGRCLMLAGYSGNKKGLASRTEMEKVQRGVTPVGRDFVAEANLLDSKKALRELWQEARKANQPKLVLDAIQVVADAFVDSVGGGERSV
jgi:hypothetical protein